MSTPEPLTVRDRRLPAFGWQDRRVAQLYIGQIGAEGFGLYCYLTHFRNGSNQCWPSLKTLGGALGWTRNTLKKYLRRLIKAGLIRVERKAFHNERGKRWQGYEFTILDLDTGRAPTVTLEPAPDGCQKLTPVHACAPAQMGHGCQNLPANGCQNLTPNKIYRDLDINTHTPRAREDAPLVAHEPPVDEPQAHEDESPCVCEDDSSAEEPQAPAAEPPPIPEPQAEAAQCEAPPACERFDVLAVRGLKQPMCPHVQGALDLMAELDYPCDERFYRVDPQGRLHAFAHDLRPEEQRDYLCFRLATEVGDRYTFLAPATCLSRAWVANGLPLARQWVAKQRAKAKQQSAGRFEPPPPQEQLSAEEVKALCARTIAEVERGPGRRRQKHEEEPQDAA